IMIRSGPRWSIASAIAPQQSLRISCSRPQRDHPPTRVRSAVISMREAVCLEIARLVMQDAEVAAILSDISLPYFKDAFEHAPDRTINVGIMEQTLVGVAAGFALEGFHPIAHTIAPFLVERPFEQLKIDFGYQGLGGTFVGVGGSFDYAVEGATHHSPGDVALVATIPGFEIATPG